jgi:putative MATE family efflux protein
MSQAVIGRASAATPELQARASNWTLLRYLFALSLPVLAEHVLHIAVGLNDTYLANHLPTNRAEAAAAVGTVQYLFWFIGLFAGAIGTGSTAIIARAAGAKHRRRANSVCGQSMLFALFAGLTLGILTFLFPAAVADFTGLQGQAHDYALTYLRMLSPAVPCVIVMMVANACLRGAGDTLTPAIAMIVVDVVNIFFSWSLTFGWFGFPRLGFNGIAIGTVIAYVAGGILQVIVLFVGRGGIRLHLHRLRPHWHDMKRILNIGLPNAGESLTNWIANFALVRIVNRTLPINVAAAAHNNAIRIESISYMTGFAFSVAVATMVGQSLGMKDTHRANRCAYLGYLVGGGFMTLVGVFFIFFSKYPANFISEDPGIRDLTAKCLHITGFCQIGFAAAIIFGGALRGAGDTWSVMLISLISVLLLRLGGVAIVGGWLHQPLPIIWIVLATDLFVRGVLIYARFLQGGWKKIEV